MQFLLTKDFVRHLRKQSEKESFSNQESIAVMLIDNVKSGCGGACDRFFPCNVFPADENKARTDPSIIQKTVINSNPKVIIYIGKELEGKLLDTVILDAIDMNGESFFFIPPVPQLISTYDLVSV